ncbi:MAG: TPMT family class I SAM-dependent methyltransferase [Flavobacteriaceae bacterium]|nr:TPMT family class I SAM-dependent methyltransferase [Flavobacteriaceae bacterium]
MNDFNVNSWKDKYLNNATGWDIGHISTPLKEYFEQLENEDLSILIPGCGNGYEAEFLHNLGFKNVSILDIAEQPLENFNKRVPYFPKENLIHGDFFSHNGTYDLIIEQTFFCALNPILRKNYVKKISQLLVDNGKLVGLLFDFPLTEQGPPFGGSIKEYIKTFSQFFKIKTLERSYNSIDDRQGKELFIIFEKR